MYIENKGVDGIRRIGLVEFSSSGRTLRYRGRQFRTRGVGGFKANYFDCESGEDYWIYDKE
jgi:hypothetical protein